MEKLIRIAILVMTVAAIVGTSAVALTVAGVGGSTISVGSFSGVGELSGITYVGPTGTTGTYRYYAVSDNASGEGATPRAYGIDVALNMTTGAITSATVISQLSFSVGYDVEGIVYKLGRLFVSDENSTSSRIREYNPSTGMLVRTLTVPAVFANGRDNFGFESLTYGPNLWTANEEALTVDGDISTTSTGTIVRLLKYDYSLVPTGQWAYQTDPKGWGVSQARCGVSDLVSLPDGTLLVLERYLGYNYRSRIYQVGFTGATDVSGIAGLSGATYTKTSKTRLWEMSWSLGDTNCNYEGLCLGPQLNDGSWSMLMVADNPTGSSQPIYALKASGVVPAAAPVVTSLTPSSAPNNASVTITNLSGSGFQLGAAVSLSRDGTTSINASNVSVASPTVLSCIFGITGATPGLRNVKVLNPDTQSGTLNNGFAITLPDTSAVVGTTNRTTLQPALLSYALTHTVALWGRVRLVDSERFELDDGSGTPVTVYAKGYSGISNGDYVRATGTLDSLIQPAVLISDPAKVSRFN